MINSLEDLRPGDIMFGPITGPGGLAISLGELLVDGGFRVGRVDVRHVAVVTQSANTDNGAVWIAQAMPGGAQERPIGSEHWTDRYAYARLPEDYPGQGADAGAIARLMASERIGYSWGSYLALAAWHWGLSIPRLEAWIGRRREPVSIPCHCEDPSIGDVQVALPVEAICSVLADQAWSLTGKKIFTDGRPHQCVTPSQLATRLMVGVQDGVQWGWPS